MKHEFLVNVVNKKIDMEYSWWFKLNVVAGDDTADTKFVLFGRLAQCLIGRSVEMLLQENPVGNEYIPKEITDLLEKKFTWNVAVIENTLSSGSVSFQSTAAAAPSIGFSNPPATPSVGLNSPSAVGAKGKSVEIECQSKTPNQDDDNLPLSQMGGHSATKNSTSKSYNKSGENKA
ncbi:hypothetical protein E2562_002471 [Oryza meyeriana var. granulata]|uniref:Replication factor A C-terminal domain-containing protein n=1 Tax=Oryza meyeriana var. granulata TaxID=110450 RepID=A0A6G1F2K7_9ORYZ|nr:hypothetical protein E2562_002471 [Oryza meyeriana var. granulata]